ncbi:MAG: hypothetical protein OCC49_13395 [Fibrobacterales bacterium]
MKSVLLILILFLISSCDPFFSQGSNDDQSSIEKADEAFINQDFERSKQQYTQVLIDNPNDSAGYIGLVKSYSELLNIDSMFIVITEFFNDTTDRVPNEVTGMDYGFFDIFLDIMKLDSITHNYYNTIDIDTLFKLDSLVMDTLLYIPYRNRVADTIEISFLRAKAHFISEFHESMEKAAKVTELIPDLHEVTSFIEVDKNTIDYSIIGDLDKAKTDVLYRDSLNRKISAAQNKMERMDTGSFLGDFDNDDSNGIDTDSTSRESAKTVSFYRIQDQKDNDGDGCIDEELYDNKDNDGDGLIDEDMRLVETDHIDNDQNGSHESTLTSPDKKEGIDRASSYLLFLYDSRNPTLIKNGFHGDSAQSSSYKYLVATDTLKTIPLDTLKKYIGGCWNNYTVR